MTMHPEHSSTPTRPRHSDALTIWLTGLPASGKTTLGRALVEELHAAGRRAELLDGDEVRPHLSLGLGFSPEDRSVNVRRVGFVANLLSRNGVFAICSLVSPYQLDRDYVRRIHDGRFVEVYVSAPVDVCERRDPKGLYAAQRADQLVGLTGVDATYEAPTRAEVVVPTHLQTVAESLDAIRKALPRF